MANRYANLVGSNKIKDEYQKINIGFDKVEQEMDEKPDNSFAKINDVEAEGEDAVTIEAGTGITVTTTPEEKKIRITATGEATPGPHGSEHNHDGADPIPDLVQLRDDFNVLIETGIIVESGENANGQYVRFADGTQICWTRKTGVNINLNISQQDYPYPAAFVSNPTTPFGVSMSFVVSDAVRNALLNSFVIGSNTQWSVRIPPEARTEDSADGATGYHLIAIGRWE